MAPTRNSAFPQPFAGRRLVIAAVAFGTLGLGVGIRLGPMPPVWAKYGGVGLWCALVYWLVLFISPRLAAWMAFLAALGIGCGVELLQLSDIPRTLARSIPLSKWILGTTFSAPDFPAYAVGAGLAALLHVGLARSLRWEIPRKPMS